MPVTFTSRNFKDNELHYSTVEREVGCVPIAYTGDLLHYASQSAPQSLDKTLDIGMVGKLYRLAGTLRKLGSSIVSVNFGDDEV